MRLFVSDSLAKTVARMIDLVQNTLQEKEKDRPMGSIDTVLFDFDGTIMDTNDVILMSWQHTFRTLENREEKVEKLVKTFGEPLETTMRRFFPQIPIEESIETYRSFHRDNFGELIHLFPGMRELLSELKGQGYNLGLVTSRLWQTTLQGLEKYDIREFFDAVVTAEDTTHHKPDPEPVQIGLEKLGAEPEHAIMLGDTLFDILCAKNAGVRSVLVSWSLALKGESRESLGRNAPDYVIDRPEQLLELL